jgi:hypothetical protein
VKVKLGDILYSDVDQLSLRIVALNGAALRAKGIYERALLSAFAHTNHADWSLLALRRLFASADRGRLRSGGDPLPGPGPFTIYRGVAGVEPARRVCGLSWTSSAEEARPFAHRLRWPDPGVYRITVRATDVVAYLNMKEEAEFVVMLPETARPERVE